MNLTQTVAPTEEPITLEQARLWCGFQAGVTEDDEIIGNLIQETRAYLEQRFQHRKLITQTWTVDLDYSETGSVIKLPILPLASITSIVCTDADGDTATVGTSNYQTRIGEDPRVVLSPSGSWEDMRTYDAMTITCVVGYGLQASLPDDINLLLKGVIQHMYRSKGFGVTETVSGQLIGLPNMYEHLIKSLKVEPW
jgi:uncharacterized phiE125 gp8 family phage protein